MESTRVLFHPRRDLVTLTHLTFILTMIPVFGGLYVFGAVHGLVLWVAAVQAVLVLVFVALLIRQLRMVTAVSSTELYGQGIFSPMRRVPLRDIAAVHLVTTYSSPQGLETTTQLLAVDAQGHRLFRLRGHFWPTGALTQVAAAIPAPTVVSGRPITMKEFFAAYPTAAYWFENRTWLWIAAGVIGAIALTAGAGSLMLALHLPLGLF